MEFRKLLGVDSKDWRTAILWQKNYTCSSANYEDTQALAKQEAKQIETENIETFDSIEHGFNSSRGDGLNGVPLTPEQRYQMGASMRGKHHTDEAKAKISAANMGREVSSDTKSKISKGNTGKKRTSEQKESQSQRMKGIEPKAASLGAAKWRQEHPGGWWKDHPISEESKAKMKASQQARFPNIKAIWKDGREKKYHSMNEILDDISLKPGSVHYYLNAAKGKYCSKGCRFEYVPQDT